jgi:hypothetical protein
MKICKDLAFQGDICLLAIDNLPKDCVKINKPLNSSEREAYGYHPEKGLVLAQGESRNHFHAFKDINKVEMYESHANDNKRLFLVVKENAILSHEEHDPILFPKKVYELIFQAALYSIHGTRVPQWIVENPEQITIEEIFKEKNAEIRRIMCERFGFRKFGEALIKSGKAYLKSEQILWNEPIKYYHYNDNDVTMGFIHVINGSLNQMVQSMNLF